MDIVLTPVEVRVLGSLVEKELSTPEYYPLSLNALVLACNQKSNRAPVMSLSEEEVTAALDTLRAKNLAWQFSAAGGRVPKYEHNLPAKLKVAFHMGDGVLGDETGSAPADSLVHGRTVATNLMRRELTVLAALMLRGPLTPGELRGCTARMYAFKELGEVEEILNKLMNPEYGPLVVKLAREQGRKEHRFAHLFSGAVTGAAAGAPAGAGADSGKALSNADRLALLEQKVALLADEVVALKQAFNDIKKPLEK